MHTLSLGGVSFGSAGVAGVRAILRDCDGRIQIIWNDRLQASSFIGLSTDRGRGQNTLMACGRLSNHELYGGFNYLAVAFPKWQRSAVFIPKLKEGPQGRPCVVQAEASGSRIVDHAVVSRTLYHSVKEGDTLTSIAREYGTTVELLASTNQIGNVDYLQAGRLLLIPINPRVLSGVSRETMDSELLVLSRGIPEDARSKFFASQKKSHIWTDSSNASLNLPHLGLVKLAASVIILSVVVSFCGRFLLEFVQTQVHSEVLRRQAEKETWDAKHRPKLKRWQGILNEDRDTQTFDAAFPVDGKSPTGQEAQLLKQKLEEEEMRRSYAELELAYARFLADSGLSKSGYWRGGVPPALEDD